MMSVLRYTRTCTRCRRSKPIRGSLTSPRFVCADCRKRLTP